MSKSCFRLLGALGTSQAAAEAQRAVTRKGALGEENLSSLVVHHHPHPATPLALREACPSSDPCQSLPGSSVPT